MTSFLTAEDVQGRLLEHSELSDLTDFEEGHADGDAVLPLRVWHAVAHRRSHTAPVWVSADAFLQKLHAAVDPSSGNLLGGCDCCLSRFGCADDVAAYHLGSALALADDAQRTAPAWSADRDDAMRRYLEALLPKGPVVRGGVRRWLVWARRLAHGKLRPWLVDVPGTGPGVRAAPTRGAEHETHFASPDQAALFHLGGSLTAVAKAEIARAR
jgi:hypothetical protein